MQQESNKNSGNCRIDFYKPNKNTNISAGVLPIKRGQITEEKFVLICSELSNQQH